VANVLADSKTFIRSQPAEIEEENGSTADRMSPEEVGFAMGIFRQILSANSAISMI